MFSRVDFLGATFDAACPPQGPLLGLEFLKKKKIFWV
jgi:hypothetical protein